jgi:hypothetical protein
MAYAKTSLRGEQRALRERMRALGLSRRQIAVEFARRYRLRPRAAWRHAYGWSLKEAAERISDYTARSGLDPGGAKVAMTAPHLSEYENWPGPGAGPAGPAGRRPTPYLLALLAGVYECAVHDLLDLADYEHMPPADRLIIDKTVPRAVAHRQDPQDALGTGRHAEPAWPDGLPRSDLASAASSWMAALAPMPWQPVDSSAGPHARGAAPSRGYGAEKTWPYTGSVGGTGYESTAEVPLQLSAIPPAGSAAAPATAVDVAMVRSVLDALTAHERQFGGGEARAYAMDYLRLMVWPRLHAAASAPAFSDLCALAAEFSLRAASMQLDAGSAGASRDLLGAGLPLAQESGDPVLVAWVLARFGELDVRQKNVDRAVAYTSGAAAMARRATPRARSFILAKHALALSVTGDRTATLRVLGQAQDSAARAGSAEPEWMRFYGPEHLRHDQARCLINLGMGDQAIAAAEESMRARRLSRPRAFSLAVQAIGHVRSKDRAVDRACQLGAELVTITDQLASDRVKVELARVMTALRPYRTSAAVRELAEAARPVLGDSPR